MQRLVVSYTIDGGYDCGCYCQVVPVQYEDKESFLADHANAVIAYWLCYEEFNEAEKKWWSAEPRGKVKGDGEKKWNDWAGRKPQMKMCQLFKMKGVEFDAFNFIEGGDYNPPTVQTVDEWFGV